MTQLVNKASSWRTLRRKVVVGASSLALVAGMGVALAPSAMAAQDNDVNITILDADAAPLAETVVAPTGATPAVASFSGAIRIQTKKAGENIAATSPNVLTARVTVEAQSNTAAAAAADATNGVSVEVLAADANASDDLFDDGSGGAEEVVQGVTPAGRTLTTTGSTFALTSPSAIWEGDLSVDVQQVANGTGFYGPLNVKVELLDGTVVIGASTFKINIAKSAAGEFNYDTGSSTALTLNAPIAADVEANLVKSFGAPVETLTIAAANLNTQVLGPNANGVYTVINGNNRFAVDTNTGKITAAAANVKERGSFVLNASLSGGASVAVTVNVTFKDAASIAADLVSAVNALSADGWSTVDPSAEALIQGYDDGTFRPTAPVSRQAFVAFAARYLNAQAGKAYETNANLMCSAEEPSKFTDVPNNAPFCAVIRDMADAGITSGYVDGTFKPAAPITRRAISAMLFRVYNIENGRLVNYPADKPAVAPFSDVAVNAPFAAEINWAATTKTNEFNPVAITTGYSDGTFRPGANSSRQATATFFYRMTLLP